jgi:hypothetical protein
MDTDEVHPETQNAETRRRKISHWRFQRVQLEGQKFDERTEREALTNWMGRGLRGMNCGAGTRTI